MICFTFSSLLSAPKHLGTVETCWKPSGKNWSSMNFVATPGWNWIGFATQKNLCKIIAMPHEGMPKQWLVSWETDLFKWNKNLPIVVIECFSPPFTNIRERTTWLYWNKSASWYLLWVIWGCPNPNQHVYSANEIVWIHHPDLKPSLDSLKTPKKVIFVSCLAGPCRDPYS